MTTDQLQDSWLRFRRGQKLKAILISRVDTLLTDSNLEFIEKRNLGNVVFHVKFQETFDMEISLLLSEITHNWRSSLDNAVYSICSKHLDEEEFKKIDHLIQFQFPSDVDFTINKEKIKYYPAGLLELIKQTSPIVQNGFVYDYLDSELEKENFTKDQICSSIMHLQRLSNDDKHKFLSVAKLAVVDIGLVNITEQIPLELEFGKQGLKNGEILAKFRDGEGVDSRPFAKLELRITLSKCRQDSHELISFIENIEDWVHKVLTDMTRMGL
jgi:hypothetical protein